MAFFSAPEVEWLYSGVTKTKPSKRGDLGGPGLRVRLGVLPERGRHRLVEVRQVVVGDVDELVLGVAALLGDVEHPAGDGFAVAARAGAADDDRDLGHAVLLGVANFCRVVEGERWRRLFPAARTTVAGLAARTRARTVMCAGSTTGARSQRTGDVRLNHRGFTQHAMSGTVGRHRARDTGFPDHVVLPAQMRSAESTPPSADISADRHTTISTARRACASHDTPECRCSTCRATRTSRASGRS